MVVIGLVVCGGGLVGRLPVTVVISVGVVTRVVGGGGNRRVVVGGRRVMVVMSGGGVVERVGRPPLGSVVTRVVTTGRLVVVIGGVGRQVVRVVGRQVVGHDLVDVRVGRRDHVGRDGSRVGCGQWQDACSVTVVKSYCVTTPRVDQHATSDTTLVMGPGSY
jgi:hypothetical protein